MEECPNENALADLLERRLSPDELSTLESHVDGCESCRRLVAELSRDLDAGASVLPQRDASGPARAPSAPPQRGESVGRYLVLQEIGAGGMGVVYAAYDPELDRKVALKLLRPDRTDATSSLRARLLREARTMANFSHPNIVAVHDVGVHDDRLFIAMEFVQGRTLRQWLEAAPRGWAEVHAVFVAAGGALAAAHAAGIVHRDFKPDNVLVGADGRVRVTDFGLAHRAGRELGAPAPQSDLAPTGGDALHTHTGAIVGTPGFIAPEQLEGGATDPRTDQYSFCVSLYWAIHGAWPPIARVGSAEPANAEPPSPAPPRVRAPRYVASVLQRGLAPRPGDRFASMTDLLRALDHTPRRRRRALGLAVLVGALATGVLVWMRPLTDAPPRCAGAAQKLAGVWNDDRKRSLGDAFRAVPRPFAASTWSRVQRAVDARARDWAAMFTEACVATRVTGEQSEHLLDLRMRCLDDRRRELGALLDVFERPDVDVASRALSATLALRPVSDCGRNAALLDEAPMPADAAARTEIEAIREALNRVRADKNAGRYRAAEPRAADLVRRARAVAYRPIQAEALALWAAILEMTADYKGSTAAWSEAILAAEAGRMPRLRALAWMERVWPEGYLGRGEPALADTVHAERIIEGMGGDAELEGLLAKTRGSHFVDVGRTKEAADQLRLALQKLGRVLGPDHLQLSPILNNLGLALALQGDVAGSIDHMQRALALQEKALGPDHPTVGHTLFNVAATLADAYRLPEARAAVERSLRVLTAALGAEHPLVASAYNVRGRLGTLEGRYAEARDDGMRAVAIGEKTRSPKDRMMAMYRQFLGEALLHLGDHAGARRMLEGALRAHIEREGDGSAANGVRLLLGEVALAEGNHAEAIALLERGLPKAEPTAGTPDVAPQLARFALARALWAHVPARREEARTLAQQALRALEPRGPALERARAPIRRWLAAPERTRAHSP